MAGVGKLTALAVARAHKVGMLGDGGGLYLRVAPGGSKGWIFRYKIAGRSRHLGLGPLHTITLAQARERATNARRLLLDGQDPIEVKRASRAAARLETARAITFSECAEAYIAAHRAGWRNAKHAAQWGATLTTYAAPIIGSLPVQAIDTALVCRVLEPIWTAKVETASRLRGRIESILDWAKVRDYRDGENPARWRGHLDHLLPARSKVRKVVHHAALAYTELPSFMVALRSQEGVAAQALQFAILTAGRTGEVLGATWSEISFDDRVWTVPAVRMKAGFEHRVPLNDPALTVLEKMRAIGIGAGYVFPGQRRGKPVGIMSMTTLLTRMERRDITTHGFRSSFRDWTAEQTNFPSEVAEMALAHAVGDKVEAAYLRTDLLDRRRLLMDSWGRFCTSPPMESANVVSLHAASV